MRKLLVIFTLAALFAVAGCEKGTETPDPDPDQVRSMAAVRVTDIVTKVDADAPGQIEADLTSNALWVNGGGFSVVRENGSTPDGDFLWDISFEDADEKAIATGKLIQKNEDATWRPVFNFLPINAQIQYSRKWIYQSDGGEERECGFYCVSGPFTRAYLFFGHYRLYEDLTEYYQAKFPDAGVRNVVRVMVIKQIKK